MRLDEFSAPLHIDGVFDNVERTRFVSFGFDLIQRSSNSFGVSSIIQGVRVEKSSIIQGIRPGEPKVVGK